MTDTMAALLADETMLGRRVAELILESDAATWATLATLTGPDARLTLTVVGGCRGFPATPLGAGNPVTVHTIKRGVVPTDLG